VSGASPSRAIDVDQNGNTITGDTLVFTGNDPLGGATGLDCEEWTSMAMGASATVGDATATTVAWSNTASQPCDQPARLYCFQR
jgi:hypothetical protein